jgi:nitroreductase
MAETLGLGSCWAGVLEGCALAGCLPLLRLLDIPEGMTFTGALALGYPRHRHRSIPERNPLQVIWKK